MNDHCIIVKNHVSDREKALKKKFLSNKKAPLKPEIKNEEPENKFSEEEKTLIQTVLNPQPKQTKTNLPMNMVFNQNKLLERNVEILHETQKSLQNMLVYNLKKKEEIKSEPKQDNSLLLVKELIAPLYQSINQMNSNMQEIMLKQGENSRVEQKDKLDTKVTEMFQHYNTFKKEDSQPIHRLTESASKKKSDRYMNAFTEIGGKLENVTEDIALMTNKFTEQFAEIKRENNKRALLEGTSKGKKRKSSFDYESFKKELVEIELETKSVLTALDENQGPDRKIRRFKKSEKINFSYKLDEPLREKTLGEEFKELRSTRSVNRLTNKSSRRVETRSSRKNKAEKKTSEFNFTAPKKMRSTGEGALWKESNITSQLENDYKPSNRREETVNKQSVRQIDQSTRQSNAPIRDLTGSHRKIANKVKTQEKDKSESNFGQREQKIENFLQNTVKQEQKDNFTQNLIKAEEESKEANQNVRKDVISIENTETEKNQQNLLEDVILKLCLDKMIPAVESDPKPKFQYNIPFDYKKERVKDVTMELILERLRLNRREAEESMEEENMEESSLKESLKQSRSRIVREVIVKEESEAIKKLESEVNLQNKELMTMIQNLNSKLDSLGQSSQKPVDYSEIAKIMNPQKEIVVKVNIEREERAQPAREEIKEKEPFIVKEQENLEIMREDKSEYSHPFEEAVSDFKSVTEELPKNYSINMDDYLISATSILQSEREHILEQSITSKTPNSVSEGEVLNESLSEGQIPLLKQKIKLEDKLEKLIEPSSSGKQSGETDIRDIIDDTERLRDKGLFSSSENRMFSAVEPVDSSSRLPDTLSFGDKQSSLRLIYPKTEDLQELLRRKQKLDENIPKLFNTISEDSNDDVGTL